MLSEQTERKWSAENDLRRFMAVKPSGVERHHRLGSTLAAAFHLRLKPLFFFAEHPVNRFDQFHQLFRVLFANGLLA
jgi:hypothetical protein